MYYISNFSLTEKLNPLFHLNINDVIEISIVILFIYFAIRYFKNTRIWVMSKGLIIIGLLYLIAYMFSFKVLSNIFNVIIIVLLFAMAFVFQPELKKLLELIGTKGFSLFSIKKNKVDTLYFNEKTIDEVVDACLDMGEQKTGALILLERNTPLNTYIDSGIIINGEVTKELLINVFEKNTPLHDGAVVIQNNIVKAATCYLPISNRSDINKNLGTRHRAAVGASEDTDAVIIVVSEETGRISAVINGEIKRIKSKAEFKAMLNKNNEENFIFKKQKFNLKNFFWTGILSFIIGVITWLTITDIADPVVTVSYPAIPVTLENEEKLSAAGYTFDITDGNNITVYATGKKSKIASFTADQIDAKADLSELSITNSTNIKATCKSPGITLDTKNALLTLSIDEENSTDCSIEIRKSGKEKDGYYISELTPEYKTITVTGAKNKIKTIDKAVVTVDVEGKDKDIDQVYNYIIYDKNGNVFDLTGCKTSCDNIRISGKTYKTKNVKVKVSAYDSSNENCNVEVISSNPNIKEITIAGPDEILKNIEDIDFSFDVSANTSKNIALTADIENYIPEGCFYAGDVKELEVKFSVNKKITTSISVKSDDIEVKGNRQLKDKTYSIVIEYDPYQIESPDISMLHPYVDIADIKNNKVPLKFNPEHNIVIKETKNIEIAEK